MSTTVHFTGRVVSGDDVVFSRVNGHYVITQRGAFKSWGGVLIIESGEPPSLFNGSIVTDDGRKGKAFGTEMSFFSNEVTFCGSGPI